jgi:hypothetical protein
MKRIAQALVSLALLSGPAFAAKELRIDLVSVDTERPNVEGKIRLNLAQIAAVQLATASAVDEQCLTYEAGTNGFEWQSCGSGGGLEDGDYGDVTVADDGATWTVEGGDVDTAAALAANGANCSAGSYPLGVDASGAAESCTVAGTIGGTLGSTADVPTCASGTGGVTAKACTAAAFPVGAIATPSVTLGTATCGWYRDGSTGVNAWGFACSGTHSLRLMQAQMDLASNFLFTWGDTVNGVGTTDTGIRRHSAGVVRIGDGGGGIRTLLGGGAAVASAAALPVPTGNVVHVTGTTNITSITSTNFQSGACVTLIFDDVLTLTDGNNIKIAGDFITTADDTIRLCFDGSNWFESGARSIN